MINSLVKGKIGERELSQYLREHGFEEARRGRQFQGGQDSPDVIGMNGYHIECKRVEAGNLYKWLDQARADAGTKVPVVMHRRNNREWVAIIPLEEFLKLVKQDMVKL